MLSWRLRTADVRKAEKTAEYLSRTTKRSVSPEEARITLMRLNSWANEVIENDGDVTDKGVIVYHGPLDFMYKKYSVTDLQPFYNYINQ